MAPIRKTTKRSRLLKTLMDHPHRFMVYRTLGQCTTFAFLFLIPALGVVKVDLWQAKHELFMKEVPLKHALAGVCSGIVACYVLTFLINLLAGRLFCGWGCPVGETSRLGEKAKLPRLKKKAVIALKLAGAAYSAALVVAVMSWWVDLRVFFEPFRASQWGQIDWSSTALAWSIFLVGTLGAYFHAHFWRWSFCTDLCPIGLYYSVVSPAKHFGVHFRNQMDACLHCDACVNVCPVGLDPKDLMSPLTQNRGLSLMDAPARNHCLECGDCIQACEFMINSKSEKDHSWAYHDACPHVPGGLPLDIVETAETMIPLKLGWYSGNQSEPKQEEHA